MPQLPREPFASTSVYGAEWSATATPLRRRALPHVLSLLSGHTLKHLLATLAAAMFLAILGARLRPARPAAGTTSGAPRARRGQRQNGEER